MFHNTINKKFCEDCGKELASKYSNVRRSRLRQSAKEQSEFRDNLILKSLDESWVSIVSPPANMQNEESCLFMLNFNKTGDTMITSSVNVIDIWDFKTKEKRKSLLDHTEIVTCVELLKSPKDELFISCSLDKTMKVWKDYRCIDTLTHHQDWLRCMSISKDNQYLISGCVSSVIWGYDLEKRKPIFSIVNKDGKSSLNTINSLNFQQDSFVFLSGTRDGYIKLFDIRDNPTKPIQEIYSHTTKLNSAVFGQNNNMILSAGRDSAARLWDLRMLDDPKSAPSPKSPITGFVAEYKGHTSQGYNIASHFFFDDKYIITGSEDGYIYIYNASTTEVVRKIPAGMKIIHLLKPYPNPEVGFAYSGLQKSTIHFYDAKTTEDQKPRKEVQNKVDEMGVDQSESTVKFIEDFMSENGDLILKVFHSNNITYSSGMTWDNLIKVITREEDEDSRRLVRKLNEVLVRNMQQYLQDPEAFGAKEQKSPSESQDTSKKTVYRDIDRPLKSCPTCQNREHIKMAELDSLDTECRFLKDLP